jgi:hypothetical protein
MPNNILRVCIVLCLSFIITIYSLQAAENTFIKSDWLLDDPNVDKTPISAIEIEKREEVAKEFELDKKQKAEEIEKIQVDNAEKRKGLIECLNKKDVTLFSIEDCPACKMQRAYFGDDFDKLKHYVDCNKNKITCPLRQIKQYPTWYFGTQLGIRKTGAKDLPTLARLSGCTF